jgi:hypothetical protein
MEPITAVARGDFLGALGLTAGADEATIRAAFKARALQLHPDRRGGSNEGFTALKHAADAALERLGKPQGSIWDEFVAPAVVPKVAATTRPACRPQQSNPAAQPAAGQVRSACMTTVRAF